MPQPGKPSAAGEDWLVRRVQDLERTVKELAAANPFAPMGMKPDANGVTFGGSVVINGNLSVPNGSISNAALQNPLTSGSAGYTASNQSFNTASTVYGTQSVTVPSGFTSALVMNGVSGGGTNSSASGDYIYVSSDINGTAGGETPTYAAAGFYASASAFGIRTLSGLTGGATITVGVRVRTGSASWAANGANIVNVNALVLFYR